jgi:hypothetical protein
MKKTRLIGHLQELDAIRKDEYMPQEVIDKVIELEQIMAKYLVEELDKKEAADGRLFDNGSTRSDNPIGHTGV